jgi:hypothetical protein
VEIFLVMERHKGNQRPEGRKACKRELTQYEDKILEIALEIAYYFGL